MIGKKNTVSIIGFEDYAISKDGIVTSYKGSYPRELKASVVNPGYPIVILQNGNIKKKFYIHRLVAIYFIPNPNNLDTVNHINGIKTDNCLENLEWLSKKDNNKHAFNTGLQASRESRKSTKISNTELQNLYKDGHSGKFTCQELATKYNLSRAYVWELSIGKYNKEVIGLKPFNHVMVKGKRK